MIFRFSFQKDFFLDLHSRTPCWLLALVTRLCSNANLAQVIIADKSGRRGTLVSILPSANGTIHAYSQYMFEEKEK